jgi:hypothetical protein
LLAINKEVNLVSVALGVSEVGAIDDTGSHGCNIGPLQSLIKKLPETRALLPLVRALYVILNGVRGQITCDGFEMLAGGNIVGLVKRVEGGH